MLHNKGLWIAVLLAGILLFGCQNQPENERNETINYSERTETPVNENTDVVIVPEKKPEPKPEPSPVCGNGKTENGEECDPWVNGSEVGGNCPDGEACVGCKCKLNAEETETYCGDGDIQRPNSLGVFEECERGIESCPRGRHCENSSCKCIQNKTYCGDGIIQRPNSNGIYEECEIGALCRNNRSICGDGTCACIPNCGDGICFETETYGTCPKDCPPPCGDGICQPEENYTSCSFDCKLELYSCGNGILEGIEQCETNVSCAPYQFCNMTTCLCKTPDTDRDGYPDYADNCPNIPNNQVDMDGDGIGDSCDPSPVDCERYCLSFGYPIVAALNVTRAECTAFAAAEISGCTAYCTRAYYSRWDYGYLASYSCCCKKTETKACAGCGGPNMTCPGC